jgi:hypothetical protein
VFIKKLFGKKNDGFYLQLEDEKDTPKPAAKAKSEPPASKAPAPVAAAPAAPVTPAAPAVQAAPVAPAPVAQSAPAEQEAKKSVKKSVKKEKPEKKVEETKAPVAAPVAPPVVAAAPEIKNFATDYLIKPSSNSSRRRPGANMNGFLNMARQAKKPEPFKK